MVELILIMEEFAPSLAADKCGFLQETNIPARTKAAPFSVINDDARNRIVTSPSLQLRRHRMNHVKRQGVECRWTVKADDACPSINPAFDILGHCRNKSRPTIMRITWLVPSRIECTRKSRQKRSIG